jgi:coiled-coil and C2 domain-containing protein 2A
MSISLDPVLELP